MRFIIILVFDSSSKIQSTILGGNLIDFGGFDQCLEIHEETDSGLIDGKHCIVEIKPSEKIMKIVVENFRNISMHVCILVYIMNSVEYL